MSSFGPAERAASLQHHQRPDAGDAEARPDDGRAEQIGLPIDHQQERKAGDREEALRHGFHRHVHGGRCGAQLSRHAPAGQQPRRGHLPDDGAGREQRIRGFPEPPQLRHGRDGGPVVPRQKAPPRQGGEDDLWHMHRGRQGEAGRQGGDDPAHLANSAVNEEGQGSEGETQENQQNPAIAEAAPQAGKGVAPVAPSLQRRLGHVTHPASQGRLPAVRLR